MISGPNKDKALAKVFKTQVTATFREADPAQIMFFGNIFGWAHDTFEKWILEAGYQWKDWFKNNQLMVPIRHTSADYTKPFYPGETYQVEACVKTFGMTSFTMKYVFSSSLGAHAIVEMVHVVLDGKTHQPIPVPESIRQKFSPYLETP